MLPQILLGNVVWHSSVSSVANATVRAQSDPIPLTSSPVTCNKRSSKSREN